MSRNPYASTNTSPPNFSNPSYRRLSYANVAAGASADLNPARFNTLAAAISPSANAMSISQRQSQPTRQASRSSLRGMDIDGQGGNGAWKRPTSSWSTDHGRLDGRMGCLQHDEHPPFFTPSYLRRSRHVEKLKKTWDEHVADLQEKMHLNPPPPPPPPRGASLSTSSSNANLSKMNSAHVHRGVAQDVIERVPPPVEEDKSRALPSRLNEDDRWGGLDITAEGTEVKFTGVTKTQDEAASVRANHFIPKECGLYYYEVTVLSRQKDAYIGVGFSGLKVSLNRLPGWDSDSWAYHGDDGFIFAGTSNGKAYGPKFATQDVVGCGVNFRTGNAFFTKNGVYLGVAFSGVKGDRLYPSVGMRRPGDHIRINFGRSPFVFDIDRMMEQERQIVMSEITTADLASLHPPDSENVLIHNLIGQYLAHEGYIETAKAFAQDVNVQQKTLSGDLKALHLPNAEDDVHAANRQKIRKSILDGDIDKALKFTNCFYPHVLEDDRNRDIHFRLRCRKFIEMMRRYTELSSAAATASSVPSAITKSVESLSSNGHLDGGIDIDEAEDEEEDDDDYEEPDTHPPPQDTQMELDDQLHREATRSLVPDDVDMDASRESLLSNDHSGKATLMKQNELLIQALAYGQDLQSAFGSDPRPQVKKQLSDIFAIMAYTNPSESVVGQLLDPRGRVQIAEDLNGAILVSLGKPSSAALEKLSAQTEALMDEVAARTGGSTAFINVRKDFLQA